ncbi:hypothetical protein K8T06_08775 [bacterium]|nr:hypothetical protein [bacterium]
MFPLHPGISAGYIHRMSSSIKNPRQITFILPCAGKGKRLGYSGHKELFPLLPNLRLIDFSLAHIREAKRWVTTHNGWTLRVVAVIRPWKIEVLDYIKSQLPGTTVVSVFFDENLFEWPGSVHSAQKFYGDINIVLLPDSRLGLSQDRLSLDASGQSLVSHVIHSMKNSSVVFGYLPCANQDNTIKHLGAMHVAHSSNDNHIREIVTRFQDKPSENLHLYNAYWCCYCFAGEMGGDLYQFLQRSVARQITTIQAETFYPAGAFPVDNYMDFGTQDAVQSYRANHNINSNSSR